MKQIAIIGDQAAGVAQVAAAVIGRIPAVEFHALPPKQIVEEPTVREMPSPTGDDEDGTRDIVPQPTCGSRPQDDPHEERE